MAWISKESRGLDPEPKIHFGPPWNLARLPDATPRHAVGMPFACQIAIWGAVSGL